MGETIEIHKGGSILRSWPCDTYSINIFSGVVSIQEKTSKKIVFIAGPGYYDYIEVGEE